VGRRLQSVDRRFGEQRVGHQGQPLDRLPVRGGHRRRGPMPFDDQLLDVGGVEGVEGMEREVVNDEQVDA
jgi:hypothetical protein